jgi:hypothetical protein
MSEKFQPPTEFIEGLGIDFRRMPFPQENEGRRRHNLGLALANMEIIYDATQWVDKVHVPGTAIISRIFLGLEDERPGAGEPIKPQGPRGMKASIYRAELKEKTRHKQVFGMHKLFSVETFLTSNLEGEVNLRWKPLEYYNHDGVKLENPQDLRAAAAVLEASTKKPAKRQAKLIGGYLLAPN